MRDPPQPRVVGAVFPSAAARPSRRLAGLLHLRALLALLLALLLLCPFRARLRHGIKEDVLLTGRGRPPRHVAPAPFPCTAISRGGKHCGAPSLPHSAFRLDPRDKLVVRLWPRGRRLPLPARAPGARAGEGWQLRAGGCIDPHRSDVGAHGDAGTHGERLLLELLQPPLVLVLGLQGLRRAPLGLLPAGDLVAQPRRQSRLGRGRGQGPARPRRAARRGVAGAGHAHLEARPQGRLLSLRGRQASLHLLPGVRLPREHPAEACLDLHEALLRLYPRLLLLHQPPPEHQLLGKQPIDLRHPLHLMHHLYAPHCSAEMPHLSVQLVHVCTLAGHLCLCGPKPLL
mmetsp:Transcript_35562/g.112195  ORF Transcript_35562/g.112195 Transcript_35562/m.112195 type:complete len:343 (-) Transcript_35562:373-1401(-)